MADGLFVAAASSMPPERKASYRPGRRFWPRVARQEASGEESGVGHDAQAPEDVLGVPVGAVGDLVEGPRLLGGCHCRWYRCVIW